MFYLDGRGSDAAIAANYVSSSNGADFGWWLSDLEMMESPRSRRRKKYRSSDGSSTSMQSCIDSDDSDIHTFVQDISRKEQKSGACDEIELNTYVIHAEGSGHRSNQKGCQRKSSSSTTASNDEREIGKETRSEAVCYTPEKLIRSGECRILTSSPRFVLSQAKEFEISENESSRKSRHYQKRSSHLIDSEQIGELRTILNLLPTAHLVRTPALSSPIATNERYAADGFTAAIGSDEEPLTDRDRRTQSTEQTSSSCGESNYYDRLNSTWDDCEGVSPIRRYSPEDVSDVRSNDCSLDTRRDARNTPTCLYDELSIVSEDRNVSFINDRVIAINAVASILEGLHDHPEKAAILLEEDRFATSTHDQLTRLALTIETDAEVPAIPDDANNWIRRLRDRIERLQFANKEIHGNICSLRTNFQKDEKKINDLVRDTMELRQDIHDLQYLDDLLKLLQGELAKISKRSWPFVLGHSKPHGELNLII